MAYGKGTLNKVILIGRLGKDPELKYTQTGTAVATFSLATNVVWKDQDGNQQEKTDWHKIVVWRKLAEFVGEWVKKGSSIFIEGKLQTRSWDDKDGKKHYMTEVVAEHIEFMGGSSKRADQTSTSTSQQTAPPAEPPLEQPPEDDLPF